MITSKADIWQLGLLTQSLLNLQDGYNSVQSKYSDQLMSLRQSMLKHNPRERPCAIDILHLITSKEALAASTLLTASPGSSKSLAGSASKTRGVFSSITERFMKYINKTGTKGWVISATENVDAAVSDKYVKKLIGKAWEKPEKIIKFYRALDDRIRDVNTLITLKSCITLQRYLFSGPADVICPLQDPEYPLRLLESAHTTWERIVLNFTPSQEDPHRSHSFSTLILQYTEFLTLKLKFSIAYKDVVTPSYAPRVQHSESKSLLQPELIKKLLELWRYSTKMHELLLGDPKDLRSARIGGAVAVAQEEYALAGILAHTIRACKHLKNNNDSIASAAEEFANCYSQSVKLCNSLLLVAELSEQREVVPSFPLGLDNYLRAYNSDAKMTIGELSKEFGENSDIMGVRMPQSTGPVKDTLIDEPFIDEDYFNDPPHSENGKEEVKAVTSINSVKSPAKKLSIAPNLSNSPASFKADVDEDSFRYFDYLPPPNTLVNMQNKPTIPKPVFDTQVAIKPPIKIEAPATVGRSIESVDLLGLDSPAETRKESAISAIPLIPLLTPQQVPLAPVARKDSGSSSGQVPNNSVRLEKPRNILQEILEQEAELAGESLFIDMKEVKFEELIGAGASAEVYKGIYRTVEVAIKKLKLGNKSASMVKEFKREVTVLSKLRHPNLVLFMGAGRLPEGNMCILTEYCKGGNLFKLLHQSTDIQLSWKQRCKIALDIAKGMSFLHSCKPPFIHRDLKSLNLLLTEPVRSAGDYINVKVTDFGLTRYQVQDQYMTANAGTNHWMAPEICVYPTYTVKADVYSFAIVLWEIVTRDLPYRNLPVQMIPYRVVYYNERPDVKRIPSDCPPQVSSSNSRS